MKKEMWNNIEKLSELRSNYSCFDEREQPYYHALSLGIEGIKALEQEPNIGRAHWIEGRSNNPKIHNILCSCCFEGYPSKGHANSQYTREKFKYCPNCGAKMEKLRSKDGKRG